MPKWNKQLMFREDDTVCCVLHLHGWGERGPSFTVGDFTGKEEDHADHIEEVKEHLRVCVKGQNQKYRERSADSMMARRVHRMAYIQTVTSSLQPYAEKYLEELGFTKVGSFEKEKHPDSVVTLWVMPAKDFLKAIDWKE